jgi:hypothetical protein
MTLLKEMQSLLARLYDAPVDFDIYDFLVTDRQWLRSYLDDQHTDEQVLVEETEHGVNIGVYIDERVLHRLEHVNPLQLLNDENIADYCTALEGVSHFHYLVWNAERNRPVSLLELEVQAEVDKYAAATLLMTMQREGRFPAELHHRLFHRIGFASGLAAEALQRYQDANRQAAKFCRRLDERFLKRRQARPEEWLAELRRFYRYGQREKMGVV